MRKEDGLFIMRFHRNLVILEIIECTFWSIIVAIVISIPTLRVFAKEIDNPFFVFIFTTSFNFIFLYFLFFKSRIKEIKNNLFDIIEKKLIKKVRKLYEKISDCERIIYQNRMNDNRISAVENKLKVKEKKYTSKISGYEKIINAIKISEFD